MNPRDSIVTYTWRTTLGAGKGMLRAFWAEVGGVNRGGVIGPKRKSMALSSWERAALPPTLESQITIFLVFLITRSMLKRFNECLICPFLLSRASNTIKLVSYNRLPYEKKE